MMKKWIVALSLVLFLAWPAHANQVLRTVIAETTLTFSDSNPTVTLYIGDTSKLVVFIDYVPDGNEQIDITFDVSYDNSNWVDANFYDYTSSAVPTLQDSESLTTETWYYAYWLDALAAPYMRVHLQGSGWSAA